jgi:putative two-component system response regulator
MSIEKIYIASNNTQTAKTVATMLHDSLSKSTGNGFTIKHISISDDLFDTLDNKGNPDILFIDNVSFEGNVQRILKDLQLNCDAYRFPVMIISGMSPPSVIFNKKCDISLYDIIFLPFKQQDLIFRTLKLVSHYYEKKCSLDILSSMNMKVQSMSYETIMVLSQMVENKDDITGMHIERVSEYSGLVASVMGIGQTERQLLGLAARVHDIGKIAIKDNILLKPSKLTAEEFEVAKTHTAKGFELLNRCKLNEFMSMSKDIALYHHERWDGNGYPYGIRGENIPLFARIVGVIDVFDALIHKRVYKPAYSVDQSIEYIIKQREKQFDPEVVDAFVYIFIKEDLHVNSFKQQD